MNNLVEQLRLSESISRERNINLDYSKVADKAADEIERLTKENAELKADAARYRQLRNEPIGDLLGLRLIGEDLDWAVDKDMAKESK